ncbi:MAG: hypothetical protein BGO31_11160 [Bacteroidetes bacterium 43-16]|mgnify:CR=1 FL=1|nr:MAG: hypothetical protein BGO31_11160 [Bacteroidetes bacterium 43-16]
MAIVAMAGLLTIGSCNNDAGLELLTEKQETVSGINDGRDKDANRWLIFKDMHEFESTIAKLASADDQESLAKWAQQNKGFTSWGAIANADTVESKEVQKIDLPDPMLSTVLNKDGRIQIADTIYQMDILKDSPVLYAFPSRYGNDLIKGVKPTGVKQVVTHKIGLTLMPFFPKWEETGRVIIPEPNSQVCDYPGGSLVPWWGQKGDLIYGADNGAELLKDNGRQVRIDYHRWRVGFVFYSSAGVRVKLQKNTRLGGWMSTINMNKVSIEACSRGDVLVPGFVAVPFQAQVSASATNTNKIERTIKWAAAPFHVEVLPRNFNFKFSVNYKGQQISRFIRE